MTQLMETVSALLAICAGNSPVTGDAKDAEIWCFASCMLVHPLEIDF